MGTHSARGRRSASPQTNTKHNLSHPLKAPFEGLSLFIGTCTPVEGIWMAADCTKAKLVGLCSVR